MWSDSSYSLTLTPSTLITTPNPISWFHTCDVRALMLPAEELQSASDRAEAHRHQPTHFSSWNRVNDYVTVDVAPLAARRPEFLAPWPLGGAVRGVCRGIWGVKRYTDSHGDCASASGVGTYDTLLSGIDTLQACARVCAGCASCRYISFSLKRRKCAWFARCDMSRLKGSADDGYYSMHVRGSE